MYVMNYPAAFKKQQQQKMGKMKSGDKC